MAAEKKEVDLNQLDVLKNVIVSKLNSIRNKKFEEKSIGEFSLAFRVFLLKFLKLNYEFTDEELASELDKKSKNTALNERIMRLINLLTEVEYEEKIISKSEFDNALNEVIDIIKLAAHAKHKIADINQEEKPGFFGLLALKFKRKELKEKASAKKGKSGGEKKKNLNFLHKLGFFRTPEEKIQIALQKDKEKKEKERKKLEELKRKELEERKRELEKQKAERELMRQKDIEEIKRKDEIRKKQIEEEEAIWEKLKDRVKQKRLEELEKKRQEEARRKEEARLRKLREQEERQSLEEEKRKKDEITKKQAEEEKARQEELRRKEELRKQAELEKKQKEEERARAIEQKRREQEERKKQKELERQHKKKLKAEKLDAIKNFEVALIGNEDEQNELKNRLRNLNSELKEHQEKIIELENSIRNLDAKIGQTLFNSEIEDLKRQKEQVFGEKGRIFSEIESKKNKLQEAKSRIHALLISHGEIKSELKKARSELGINLKGMINYLLNSIKIGRKEESEKKGLVLTKKQIEEMEEKIRESELKNNYQ